MIIGKRNKQATQKTGRLSAEKLILTFDPASNQIVTVLFGMRYWI
jgi:hypothetical protein